jgi:Ca2+-binding EF-hand superfamily protein
MGKRDMQALEAMGVADLDKEFLGHKTFKNVKATINESFDLAMARDEKEDPAASKVSSASMVKQASDSLNAKFTNMRKAFQDIDLDHSGSLSAEELWQAFDRLNLQLDRHSFKALITACDKDGNGNISYEEVCGRERLATHSAALASCAHIYLIFRLLLLPAACSLAACCPTHVPSMLYSSRARVWRSLWTRSHEIR